MHRTSPASSMARLAPRAAAVVLAAVIASPAWSQQLNQLPSSNATAPAKVPAQVNAPPASTIRSDPSQRAAVSSPVPVAGPAKQVAPRTAVPVAESPRPAQPQPVRDRQGRIVPGAVRTSPNRAYDPATGRVTPTLPEPASR